MIKIEKLYGGSMKESGIFLATLALFFHLLNLIFMDFSNNSYLLHSDLKDDLGRSVVFYSLVVGTILETYIISGASGSQFLMPMQAASSWGPS